MAIRTGRIAIAPLRVSRIALALAVAMIGIAGPGHAQSKVDPNFLAAIGQTPAATPMMVDQGASSIGPSNAGVFEEGGERWLDVWLRGDLSRPAVESTGAIIGTVAGDVMSARIPARLAGRLLSIPGLQHLQLAQGLEPQLDRSVPEIGAPTIWGGGAPDFGTQTATTTAGNGVVIGIVDGMIDTGHPDLRTASGTRFLRLWNQAGSGTPPPEYTYGAEYTGTQINSGLFFPNDLFGHATHIASVAAGNSRANAPSYTYVGVAPEADLVGVILRANGDGTVSDTYVIAGVDYVFKRAAALGKSAVVLLALGKLNGPHDGSDPLDAGLSALTGSGKLIVAAAGNYNGTARHAEITSTASNQNHDVTVKLDPYTTSSLDENYYRSEGWYNSSANYQVSVITPTGQTIGPVSRGATTQLQTPDGFVRIENGTYTSANGSYRAEAYVFRGGPSYPQIAAGTWTIRFRSQVSGTNRVDNWVTSYRVGSTKPIYVTGMTNRRLITSPGNANNVVCVSAYSTKREWTDAGGQIRTFYSAVVNEIANFSSPGPRRDDVAYPHIAAPGYGVAAALSGQASPSTTFILPGQKHWINYGTSVAAAHVAGAAALKLGLNRNLTPAQFLTDIQRLAAGDSYADSLPNNRWGSGKLRLVSGSTDVAYSGPRTFSMGSPYPNPTRGSLTVEFVLAADHPAPVDGAARLRIVDVMGREVRTMQATATIGPVRFRWDGTTNEGSAARAGIYFARVEVGTSSAVEKFVLID